MLAAAASFSAAGISSAVNSGYCGASYRGPNPLMKLVNRASACLALYCGTICPDPLTVAKVKLFAPSPTQVVAYPAT